MCFKDLLLTWCQYWNTKTDNFSAVKLRGLLWGGAQKSKCLLKIGVTQSAGSGTEVPAVERGHCYWVILQTLLMHKLLWMSFMHGGTQLQTFSRPSALRLWGVQGLRHMKRVFCQDALGSSFCKLSVECWSPCRFFVNRLGRKRRCCGLAAKSSVSWSDINTKELKTAHLLTYLLEKLQFLSSLSSCCPLPTLRSCPRWEMGSVMASVCQLVDLPPGPCFTPWMIKSLHDCVV